MSFEKQVWKIVGPEVLNNILEGQQVFSIHC